MAMSFHPAEFSVVVANITRIAYIIAGMFPIYLGYRLFTLGFSKTGGEFNGEGGGLKIALRNVAPGVFFALFGMGICVSSLVRPIDVVYTSSAPGATSATDASATPDVAGVDGGARNVSAEAKQPSNGKSSQSHIRPKSKTSTPQEGPRIVLSPDPTSIHFHSISHCPADGCGLPDYGPFRRPLYLLPQDSDPNTPAGEQLKAFQKQG